MAFFSIALTNIIGAVKKAAGALTRDFNELEHLQNNARGNDSFALHSYEKVFNLLHKELTKYKPYNIVDKANSVIPASGNYFAIAPINGFANFAHGNGNFAISVALIENNNLIDAVIYNPIYDELFFAEKGSGAFKEGFRNHERLRVAGVKNIDKALLACNADINVLQKAVELSPNVSINGSVALSLAYVAAGKLDAVIANKSYFAELAAGILLVKEAGGYVFSYGQTDIRSEDLNRVLQSGSIVATNEALKQKLASEMAK